MIIIHMVIQTYAKILDQTSYTTFAHLQISNWEVRCVLNDRNCYEWNCGRNQLSSTKLKVEEIENIIVCNYMNEVQTNFCQVLMIIIYKSFWMLHLCPLDNFTFCDIHRKLKSNIHPIRFLARNGPWR